MDEPENLCVDCGEKDGSGPTGRCPDCLFAIEQKGWKVSPYGVMKNRSTGVKVTRSGRVTVTAMYNPRMMALMAGDIEVADLDDEELARGMCRNEDGKFPRKKPEHVPRVMLDAMQKILFERAEDALKASLVASAEQMAKLAADPEVEPRIRLQAATWIYERLRGKAPQEVKFTQDKPFEQILTKVRRGPRPPVAEPPPVG